MDLFIDISISDNYQYYSNTHMHDFVYLDWRQRIILLIFFRFSQLIKIHRFISKRFLKLSKIWSNCWSFLAVFRVFKDLYTPSKYSFRKLWLNWCKKIHWRMCRNSFLPNPIVSCFWYSAPRVPSDWTIVSY